MTDLNEARASQKSSEPLQLAYCRALELASFKGGFLARTAHELRSPLNKVISLQQMVLEGLCDNVEEEREFVAEAYAASTKLLEYLDFLIRVSKIETGRITPTPQAVSLQQIFDHVRDMVHLQVADRNLRLIVEPLNPEIQLYTDPTWLQNALITLIEIALDSSDRGTIHLHINPEREGSSRHIWLDDDRPTTCWHESLTLPSAGEFDLDNSLSASLRMGMVEAMLNTMDATLKLQQFSDEHCPNRLELSIPIKTNKD